MKWFFAWLVLSFQTPAPSIELRRLDYFLGTWSFEWNVPDSPLGPAGKITGTESCQKILDGLFYQTDIQGNGPLGPFEGLAILGYDKRENIYQRYEFDSLGFSTVKTGTIGSDAGGWNMIYWESSPIKRNSHTIRLKGSTHMYSPINFRIRVQISVDGGPYTNDGNPWYRKLEQPRSSKIR